MEESKEHLSRREFVAMGVTASWALATLPVTALALTTPEDGLVTGSLKIPIKGGEMAAYHAMPKGKGPFPVVLVVQEIFGVHSYIQDVCRRFAKEGYYAIAPYLYSREGDVTNMKDIGKLIADVVQKVPQEQVWADLDATLAALDKKNADTSRVAITGFCWGGNVVWTYATHNPKLKAGVAWYGRLADTFGPKPQKTPLELAATLKVPVLGLYGEKDDGIPLADVEKMKAALKSSSAKTEFIVYPGASHGFHADYRPSYDEKAAKDGWQKTLAWFKKNGMK